MQTFRPFTMERWQSTYEYRVEHNLSESGVEPLTLAELLHLGSVASVGDTPLGYGQSNGSDALRDRIATLYRTADADDVVVTNGSAEANFVAMWALVEPGDEVAIIVPTYMQTYGLAAMFGARVVEIPLREELGWQPDPDEVRARIGHRTRIVVVTNPNNPTGARLNDDARTAIRDAAERAGAWIIADEVYTGAEHAGPETPSFHGECARVIATGSLSKAYGLPGLRVGWAVADTEMAEQLWSRTDYTTISTGELSDRLARIALDDAVRPRILDRTRDLIRTGYSVLREWLDAEGIFTHQPPEAGAICLARYRAPIGAGALAERLRVEQNVLVVPGDHFGLESCLRIGIGLPADRLAAALERMSLTLRDAAGARI